jgi:hypothetical protein
MPDDRVTRTLDALVEEAYKLALDRGVAITNPDGWRNWKRAVYADTARREGPGYLRHHHQRLGLAATHRPTLTCAHCAERINGLAVRHDNDPTTYCSNQCAGIETMTLEHWLEHHATPEQRQHMLRLRRRQEGAA